MAGATPHRQTVEHIFRGFWFEFRREDESLTSQQVDQFAAHKTATHFLIHGFAEVTPRWVLSALNKCAAEPATAEPAAAEPSAPPGMSPVWSAIQKSRRMRDEARELRLHFRRLRAQGEALRGEARETWARMREPALAAR